MVPTLLGACNIFNTSDTSVRVHKSDCDLSHFKSEIDHVDVREGKKVLMKLQG